MLTAEQRIAYVRSIWAQFGVVHNVGREMSSAEYETARKWALRGVPLAVVLQGINETGGKPRTLLACERSVDENIERWHKAAGSLTVLPEPGPLEEPFDVEAARKRRDEGLERMRAEGMRPGSAVKAMPAVERER